MLNKIAIFFCVILISSCQFGNPGLPENFDFGETDSNSYKNKMFNFELPVHEGWAIQSQEELDKLMDAGIDLVSNSNPSMKRVVEASKVNTAYLFTAFKHEVGAMVEFNPSIMVMVENLNNFSGLKKGRDYLKEAKKHFAAMKMGMVAKDGYKRKKIGSRDFDLMEVDMTYAGLEIRQEYYATLINGFAFVIVDSYTNEEDKELLYKMLDGIKM